MENKLNVFCLWVGNKYSFEYVKKLRNMLSRHLTLPYQFICLTDKPYLHKDEEGIIFKQAPIAIADSWCKLSLFTPQIESLGFKGKALYLDLDVVILGNIDKIVEDALEDREYEATESGGERVQRRKSHFTIINDWWRPTYNSSMMIWEIGKRCKLYTKFKRSDMERLKGDQDLITEILEGDDTVKTFDPKLIQSYKASNLQKGPKKFTKIAVFHGKPKPHELDGWVTEHWK